MKQTGMRGMTAAPPAGWYASGRWMRHRSLADERKPEISGPEM